MADIPPNRAIRKPGITGEVVTPSRQRRDPHGDGPSPEDLERFNNVTRECPECGKQVFDDVSQCYHCGHAFEDSRHKPVPAGRLVIVVLLVLALLGVGGVVFRIF